MTSDAWFEQLAQADRIPTHDRAPARLKSRTYSALVSAMAQSGALLDLRDCRAAGGRLCIFEAAVAMLPDAGEIRSTNPCRICHARALGERMQHAPIYWPGCPYSEFHNG